MFFIFLGILYGGGDGEVVCFEDLVIFGESFSIEFGDREFRLL